MTWQKKYTGPIDDRMWGAPRSVGKVIGGIPLVGFHELTKALAPPNPNRGSPVKANNFFGASKPDLIVDFYRPGPTFEHVVIPRAKVEAWLEEHYPHGHRLGYVYGIEPGT